MLGRVFPAETYIENQWVCRPLVDEEAEPLNLGAALDHRTALLVAEALAFGDPGCESF